MGQAIGIGGNELEPFHLRAKDALGILSCAMLRRKTLEPRKDLPYCYTDSSCSDQRR